MSRGDVVQRFYRAFSERDLPALLDTLDPQIVFEPVLGVLYDQHTYHGHDEIVVWFEQLAGDWDAFQSDVESTLQVEDHVVAFVRLAARNGDRSLEAEIAVECHFNGDRISCLVDRDAWDVAQELGVPRTG